jgi:hypothetical protein
MLFEMREIYFEMRVLTKTVIMYKNNIMKSTDVQNALFFKYFFNLFYYSRTFSKRSYFSKNKNK